MKVVCIGSLYRAQKARGGSGSASYIQLSSARAATLARRLALTASRSSAGSVRTSSPADVKGQEVGRGRGISRTFRLIADGGGMADLVLLHGLREPLPLLYEK